MNYVILASHGKLAVGMKDTVEMIMGKMENLVAFSAYSDGEESIRDRVEQEIQKHYESNKIIVVTDLFGGSVNNDVISLNQLFPEVEIVTGMNAGLVISLLSSDLDSSFQISNVVEESKEGIIYMNDLLKSSNIEEDEL